MGSSLTILVPFPPDACALGKAQGAGEQVSVGLGGGVIEGAGGSLIVPLWIPCATSNPGESGLCGSVMPELDFALAIDGKNSETSMSIPISTGAPSKQNDFLMQFSSHGK